MEIGSWSFSVSPIVDVYLTNQVVHLMPHGGYDKDSLASSIQLRKSAGGEPFVPIGGEGEKTIAGEIVYADDMVSLLDGGTQKNLLTRQLISCCLLRFLQSIIHLMSICYPSVLKILRSVMSLALRALLLLLCWTFPLRIHMKFYRNHSRGIYFKFCDGKKTFL